mmetsp:Transcript_12998/g.14931  ORF Transcript_12998/g.14931 Transcript_12998/m.14931 type:complete len:141 (+) Transcript_12998:44-466(+)
MKDDIEPKEDQPKSIEVAKIGKPKSGKGWKIKSTKASNKYKKSPGLKRTWDEKMKIKEERKQLVEKLRLAREAKEKRSEALRERKKEKEKLKQENEMKSSSYQLIKDSTKIRKWNKKARYKLAKLPSAMFESVIKKAYNY